ncbi:ABC transporter ATP-binding protein [Candidatus Parcubacteria bacterium]|jgi:lipopolysaccharide transport system ATP-binding protein|nr:MAG: ABC transporter ATP-binding protein [Candidatus Parcubacteria bacterium]
MSDIAVKVENLGKLYHIGARQEQYPTLRSALVSGIKRLTTRRSAQKTEENTLWALKDISFEIKQGEVVGIIGRNGAGKSTLLKVLAHITEPTKGRVSLYGRVGSLLEVGTGFHPELTGRDNIYLNGAILGMKRVEIQRKFDEIVAFSEIEKFLDTPVKRYSSGMYVRLAFAVAAHLEPEILVVDEVLAVGDVGFQKKCLGKMGDVAKEGRTVLFVSHNMAAVSNLCNRSLLLNQGEILFSGSTDDTIKCYSSSFRKESNREIDGGYDLTDRKNLYLDNTLIIRKVRFLDENDNPQENFPMGAQMKIVVEVEGLSDYHDASVGIIFKSNDDQRLAGVNTSMICSHIDQPRAKKESAILRILQVPFTPGSYWIAISIAQVGSRRLDCVENAAQFYVIDADVYGTGYQVNANYGLVYLNANWEIRTEN